MSEIRFFYSEVCKMCTEQAYLLSVKTGIGLNNFLHHRYQLPREKSEHHHTIMLIF